MDGPAVELPLSIPITFLAASAKSGGLLADSPPPDGLPLPLPPPPARLFMISFNGPPEIMSTIGFLPPPVSISSGFLPPVPPVNISNGFLPPNRSLSGFLPPPVSISSGFDGASLDEPPPLPPLPPPPPPPLSGGFAPARLAIGFMKELIMELPVSANVLKELAPSLIKCVMVF